MTLIGGDRRSARASFEAELRRCLDALYDFACALAPPPEADDLVQATCLRALERYTAFAPGTNFKAWIFTVLKNEFVTRQRRERRQSEAPLELAIPLGVGEAVDDLEAMLIENQWSDEVREALLALPERFRVAVYLKDVAGFAYREIAEIAGCPLGTVMSRLARGRALLRGTLLKQARDRGLLRVVDRRATR